MTDTANIPAINFVEKLNQKFPKGSPSEHSFDLITTGKKYFKIVSVASHGGKGVYAFVDKVTGDLFKPAGWAAPAKHARGNINDESGLAACNKHGVAYLK